MIERDETFSVDRTGNLVRSVTPKRGEPYVHRCSRETFQAIACAIDELNNEYGDPGFVLEELARREDCPHTQAAVALAFLKERGCVVADGRRSFAASRGVFEDAMVEYWAMVEKPGG